MKISICVAIYNIDEKYLRECLDSVTADKSPQAEIILGDDCSVEKCAEICREYAASDSRIKYIRAAENGGVSRMRNAMIDAASGDYIVFVDGDDVVSEDYVKSLLKVCQTDYDIVMFDRENFSDTAPKTDFSEEEIRSIEPGAARVFSKSCITGAPPQIEKYGIKNGTPSSVCTKAYRRDFILQNNLKFKPGLKKSQDVEFNTGTFFHCKKLGYLPKSMYMYRINPTSICHRYSADLENIIDDCIKYDLENMNKFFPNDEECAALWGKYKLILHIISNFELNIFHHDNPKGKLARKEDFLEFVSAPPFDEFFKNFDFNSYDWNERRLVLRAAKKKNFELLNFMYKYPLSFRVYGKIKAVFGKLRRG